MRRRGTAAAAAERTPVREAKPASLAAIRKQRESGALARRAALGAAAVAVAGAAAALAWARQAEAPPERHPEHGMALRVLRNDGLPATDRNVRFALRLIDAATKPYDPHGLRPVDAQRWAEGCGAGGRACQPRPPVGGVRQAPGGRAMQLLEAEAERAKVWLVEEFVSAEEAEVLLARARAADYSASPTQHATGQDWRSSSSAMLQRADPELQQVLRRASALCGVPLDFVEAPQIVRYMPGERYQPHMDSDGPEHRHWTVLLYLNDPGGGGATGFPLLGLRVVPVPRLAVFWENLREEAGLPQPVRNYYTLHDGLPPTGTEPKYAINIWVRNRSYDPDAAA